MSKFSKIDVSCLLAGSQAQQSAYGQCGGNGWTGPTTCVSGYYCFYQNDWYSQCIPGSATTTRASTASTTSSSTSSKITSVATTTASTTSLSRTTTTTTRTTTSSSGPTSSPGSAIQHWFAFGDSYTYNGFNPWGTQPSTNNPLGNPAFPGDTTSGGANYIGLTVSTYKKSDVFAYGFGISGATIDPALAYPTQGRALDVEINMWIQQYSNRATVGVPWTSDNTLFSLFFGVNDITVTMARTDMDTYTDKILTSLMNQTNTLYNYGARKFMFINAPPVDRLPAVYGNAAIKANVARWNSRLLTFAADFKNTHPGSSIVVYDTWTDYNKVLDNPTAYGLKSDVQGSGADQTYFWRDAYHPNIKMHDVMAQAISVLWRSVGWW
ncbi:hypothetical protein EYR41_008846 [Orbilia oligospora]|uniref:Uncharacterized protein n=1 Tax=Orbilia oligospora TaxID=2813651 RepID=A0A7C8P884_ORBOL|nr:hypothetical protein TWF751_010278 [Orbilia oligospora]KAF3291954.1 hypothetical protein TWF132_006456 [Orbilia oligospora]TGJ67286.1 hypothetical protein EYR41_008846 [Orbilia oligospora]